MFDRGFDDTTFPVHRRSRLFLIPLTLVGLSIGCLVWQSANPQPFHLAGISIDRLSAALTLLVAAIGAVVFRYSDRYLDGNPLRRRFLVLLTITVIAAYLLMCSTNLLLLFTAWLVTSLGLHELLTIDRTRRESMRPARKKFFISRLGDIALIGAIFLIWRDWRTLELGEFIQAAAAAPDSSQFAMIAFLIALAALTKSAQFPFHSWLPETMESPTPVSALMHAGIINAGGALLIRFSPIMLRVPEVLLMLSIVGTLTFVLGTLAMWAQVKVKRILAWSTVGQMGFMMVQCGLGAFPAAALHILGHGCYKAWSFLRAGEVPPASAAPLPPIRALALVLLGACLAIPVMMWASWLMNYPAFQSPGEAALIAIVAMAIGQIWAVMLGHPSAGWSARALNATAVGAATVAFALGAIGLYHGAEIYLQPVLGDLSHPTGLMAWITAAIPLTALVALTVIHACLPVLGHSKIGRSLKVHCLHGFYFGAIADRLVDATRSRPVSIVTGINNAHHE